MENKNQKLLKEFSEMAKQAKTWYALTGTTLLNAVREKTISEQRVPEVMMTIESYEKFKSNFSKNLIDRTSSTSHTEITPHFFLNSSNTKQYIKINIVVPTKIGALKRFTSLREKANFYYSRINSPEAKNNSFDKLNKALSLPFKCFIKTKSHKTFYNKLYNEKNQGFFEISRPTERQNKHWIPQLTFRTIPTEINGLKLEIPYEFNTILSNWYDDDYMEIKDK